MEHQISTKQHHVIFKISMKSNRTERATGQASICGKMGTHRAGCREFHLTNDLVKNNFNL